SVSSSYANHHDQHSFPTRRSSDLIFVGKQINKPTEPIKENYKFVGWYTDKELTKEYDFNKVVNEDLNLYAKWEENEKVKVVFHSNGGSKIEDVNIFVGKQINKPTEPTKENYKFVGWYTDKELTKEYDFNKVVNEDLNLYAKWEEN